jgi:hypothetical protein
MKRLNGVSTGVIWFLRDQINAQSVHIPQGAV